MELETNRISNGDRLRSMCGRYGRRADKQYIAEHYSIRKGDFGDDFPEEHPFAFAPDYNITPDSFQPVVRLNHDTGERELAMMKWGLVPYWILLANSGGAAEVSEKS